MLRPAAMQSSIACRPGSVARDLHVEVRPVDPLVQADRLLVGRLRVVGEVRVDLDRHVAVLAVQLVHGRERRAPARRRARRGGGRSPSRRPRARAAPSAARRRRCPARSPSGRWSGSRSRRRRRPLPSSASARRSRAGRARGSRSRPTDPARSAGGVSIQPFRIPFPSVGSSPVWRRNALLRRTVPRETSRTRSRRGSAPTTSEPRQRTFMSSCSTPWCAE